MFKLAIENVVVANVKFTLKSKGITKTYAFDITADRLSQDEITARMEANENKYKEFLTGLVTGWSGQRLVLDADDQPAAFSEEAFALMLGTVGVAQAVFSAYMRDCGATAKN